MSSEDKERRSSRKEVNLGELDSDSKGNHDAIGAYAQYDLDILIKSPGVRIFMIIVWLAGFAIFFWFLANIVRKYQSLGATPVSTFSFEDANATSLILPQVTICNWNQNGDVSNPTPNTACPNCNISLYACKYLADGSDCASRWVFTTLSTRGGIFNCWQFNSDLLNVIETRSAGYGGSYETVWQIPSTPTTNTSFEFKGVQVTLSGQNELTPDIVYNEVQFAPMGFNTYFTFVVIQTIQRQLAPTDFLYNTTRFEASSYNINMVNPGNLPAGQGLVGVSFGYQGLSKQIVIYDIVYSVDQFFADFAAGLVILTGLTWIKAVSGIFALFVAIKKRSYILIQKHFTF